MTAPNIHNHASASQRNLSEMTLSELESASSWANVAVVALTLFAAVAGVLAWHFPSKLSAVKDAALVRFQDEAKVAISLADARSAEANEKAAEANERAVNAGKEVVVLQKEAAEARRRQAEAEKQLAEVKIRQTPRNLRIPSDMVLSILNTAPPSKAIIWYQQADAESALFAMGLNLRLRDAGWQILEYKAIPSSIVYGAGNQDIDFLMRDLHVIHSSDSLQALVRVLELAAITWGGLGDPKLPDDTPRIIIHPKP
jgi:hypothetical protein